MEYHYTPQNTYTGNSGIERFHSTLNELIRLIIFDSKNNYMYN